VTNGRLLAGVPAYARAAVAAELAPHRRPRATVRASTQAPQGSVAAFLLALVACGPGAAVTGQSPPPRDAAPAAADFAARHAQLDELDVRVTALEARRDLAAWCLPGCPAGVEWVRVHRDGVSCRCARLPSLGVRRLAMPEKARVPEEHASAPSESFGIVDEPGARGTGTASAGLSVRGRAARMN